MSLISYQIAEMKLMIQYENRIDMTLYIKMISSI